MTHSGEDEQRVGTGRQHLSGLNDNTIKKQQGEEKGSKTDGEGKKPNRATENKKLFSLCSVSKLSDSHCLH